MCRGLHLLAKVVPKGPVGEVLPLEGSSQRQ
jgi:hypothetical protein